MLGHQPLKICRLANFVSIEVPPRQEPSSWYNIEVKDEAFVINVDFTGNLHSGNVFLHGGQTALISDYEGYIFGLSSLLRPLIVQLKGPSSSAEAVDVYSFGHLLYEMSTGGRLNNPTCENAIPNAFPEILRKKYIFIKKS